MDKYKDKGILLANADLLKYCQGVVLMGGEEDKQPFNSVYRDIAESFGMDVAIQMYQMYKGMQITFPKRLFNSEYVKKQVPIEYNGKNAKQLAKKYDYTEKTIRRIIKESLKRGDVK